MYTTKVKAHAVTKGTLLFNLGSPRYVQTTAHISDPNTKQYTGCFINGVPYLFNQDVEIVVGGSVKAG
jgi:hypothetical protein